EAAQFLVEIDSSRIRPYADYEAGLRADGVAANIQATVQASRDVGKPDGIDIKNCCRIRIGTHARGVARNADQVTNSCCMRTQQFRLNTENIAVAAAKVKHRFNARVLLNDLAGNLRT